MFRVNLGVAMFGMSLLAGVPVLAQQRNSSLSEIAAAETNLYAGFGFQHDQYHENLSPGDDENGFAPGFIVGASVLLPTAWPDLNLYSALSYEFNAGNLNYGGHFLVSGAPVSATDRAVFNRVEGRLGLGLPLAGGALEAIPFLTGGYQSWNRNIDMPGSLGTDEFYNTGMAGAGLKLDIPLTASIVASGTAEMLGLFGANIDFNSFGTGSGMGNSAQERISLGLDESLGGPLHVTANADWAHFNYAGSHASAATGGLYEPLSTTTQLGVNLGLAYSF